MWWVEKTTLIAGNVGFTCPRDQKMEAPLCVNGASLVWSTGRMDDHLLNDPTTETPHRQERATRLEVYGPHRGMGLAPHGMSGGRPAACGNNPAHWPAGLLLANSVPNSIRSTLRVAKADNQEEK